MPKDKAKKKQSKKKKTTSTSDEPEEIVLMPPAEVKEAQDALSEYAPLAKVLGFDLEFIKKTPAILDNMAEMLHNHERLINEIIRGIEDLKGIKMTLNTARPATPTAPAGSVDLQSMFKEPNVQKFVMDLAGRVLGGGEDAVNDRAVRLGKMIIEKMDAMIEQQIADAFSSIGERQFMAKLAEGASE